MKSFFEKLKKEMGVEVPEKIVEKPEPKKEKLKLKVEKKPIEIGKPEEKEIKKEDYNPPTTQKEEIIKIKKEKWFEPEGELAVDVYQTEEEIIIQSAVAGIKPEGLDITIENDVLTIKGNREKPEEKGERNYFYQECYWGPFSRQIILPVEIDPSRAQASMKEGILTIRIPKIQREKKRKIEIKEK